MGLFDRFKKSEKKEVKKKPETLGEVIIQEVERYNKMTPEEQKVERQRMKVKKLEHEKKRNKEHRMVENNIKGEKLEDNGEIEEAIKCYEENIFKLKTEAPFPYDRLASLYHYKKEFEKEKTTLELFFKQVKEGTKVNERYKIDYAKRLENVEQFLNTGKWKFDCLPSDPKNIYYDIKEAKTLLKSEEKEKGVDMLEEIMKNGTYTNTVYNTLYQTYKKDKLFDEAIRVCNKAIEVLGFFSNDRKERWSINLERVTKQKEKAKKKNS